MPARGRTESGMRCPTRCLPNRRRHKETAHLAAGSSVSNRCRGHAPNTGGYLGNCWGVLPGN
eukprot:11217399-Lingulodinium_polyedra.AAC.1